MGRLICTLEGRDIWQDDDNRVHFTANATIDADGANGQSTDPVTGKPIFAYAPGNKGLDHLANAGYPDHPQWYKDILVCQGGTPVKFYQPFANDPSRKLAGYASRTAYEIKAAASNSPGRYVDSVSVPYVVVSPLIRKKAKGIVLGAKARITHTKTGRKVDAVVADIGPATKVGELSIAAADALGINSNPRTGGEEKNIIHYEIFCGIQAIVNGYQFDLIRA